ncbi:unnamed protein product [Rhizophagus irregularis]|nr:unnamed protein product [Rhizophagus irregularis]
MTPPFCRQVLMVTVWTYYLMKMGFENGMSYQDKLPWQNASQLNRQNRDDGSDEVFPHINSDFGGRRGDNMVHVWGINSQWETIGQHIQ